MLGLWRSGLVILFLTAQPAAAANLPWPGLEFQVVRNGKTIGYHRVTFHEEKNDLIVQTDVDLNVYFAFIKVYSYSHHSREVWRNDRLWTLTAQTNDNGKKFAVAGQAVGDNFEFEGANGKIVAPAGVIPTSYWHPATPTQTELLDTGKGRLFAVTPTPDGNGHVRLTGKLRMDMWYSPQGCFERLSFTPPRDSTLVEYVPTLAEAAPQTRVSVETGLRAVVAQCYPPRAQKMTSVAAEDRKEVRQR